MLPLDGWIACQTVSNFDVTAQVLNFSREKRVTVPLSNPKEVAQGLDESIDVKRGKRVLHMQLRSIQASMAAQCRMATRFRKKVT